ncbi:MAG: hypothetical protein MZU97_14610 [Bacillus subtilis]|nr:hypothetical protein [Bacillus subtilis]
MLGYGVFYILIHRANLVAPTDIPGSIYAYIVLLVLFYLIFLLQSMHNEKLLHRPQSRVGQAEPGDRLLPGLHAVPPRGDPQEKQGHTVL